MLAENAARFRQVPQVFPQRCHTRAALERAVHCLQIAQRLFALLL